MKGYWADFLPSSFYLHRGDWLTGWQQCFFPGVVGCWQLFFVSHCMSEAVSIILSLFCSTRVLAVRPSWPGWPPALRDCTDLQYSITMTVAVQATTLPQQTFSTP